MSQSDVKCPLFVYFFKDFKTSAARDFVWCTAHVDGVSKYQVIANVEANFEN